MCQVSLAITTWRRVQNQSSTGSDAIVRNTGRSKMQLIAASHGIWAPFTTMCIPSSPLKHLQSHNDAYAAPRPLPAGPPAAAFAFARAATARPLPPTPVATFLACTLQCDILQLRGCEQLGTQVDMPSHEQTYIPLGLEHVVAAKERAAA